jgi:hypothetical protein
MKLKTFNHHITISSKQENCLIRIYSTFIIGSIPVNEQQALEIAKILYPGETDIKIEQIENK